MTLTDILSITFGFFIGFIIGMILLLHKKLNKVIEILERKK